MKIVHTMAPTQFLLEGAMPEVVDQRGCNMEKIELTFKDGLSELQRRSQFLALLAHELRNPLAPIRNAVQILRMAPDVSMGQHDWVLPMMERQLEHMARLLDDLLDVSRISDGEVGVHKEGIDAAQAMQVGVEASKPLIDSIGHQLSM